ncbi:DUF4097 domain-containing protein [Paenibacillus sp. N4]|uniref:DUF6677 family protein n=1 Tax=Paenibacillus vietnamensis TaxID=2590547 RepID=UPI001CD0FAC9|nr:DUF6677 family protein [Paenibacillus vietnamensis]MCA0756792.1 DUF4097 domain-containing protein [Paenibacillus vietnamensis]
MGKLGIIKNKNRLAAVILAFLLPGAGHLYTGHHPRGLLLIAAFLLDVTAIIRLAGSDGGRHLLLIVYLGIMLPVFYFFSVFDSLQDMEADRTVPVSFGFIHGVLLSVSGAVMLVLVKPPEMLLPWMNEMAEFSVGPILMIASVWLLRSGKGEVSMIKLGRFTAGTLVLTVGALLLWDQIKGRNDLALLGQWWPVIFIALGIEVTLFSLIYKKEDTKLKLDAAGGMIALVITVTAYSVTQYADFPFKWLDQFNVDLNRTADYGDEKGFRYDKAVIKLPLEPDLSLIRIINPNGQVSVRSADVQEIEVQTAVWVDVTEQADANDIAEQSTVKVEPGQEVTLEAKGKEYGANGSRKPWMNITVTVPLSLSDQVVTEEETTEDPLSGGMDAETGLAPVLNESGTIAAEAPGLNTEQDAEEGLDGTTGQNGEPDTQPENDVDEQPALKMKVEAGNGPVDIQGLALPGGLDVKSTSGVVTVGNIYGPVTVKGNNGNIDARSIRGESSLETNNGMVKAVDIEGRLFANTLNGSLELKRILDDIQAETKNGKIRIDGAGSSVKADTLNGSIELNSPSVGGDWDLDSSVGEIKISMPEYGDFKVNGSVTFGNISTDLPLEVSKKTVRGTIGEGTYRIQINATNSISITRFKEA